MIGRAAALASALALCGAPLAARQFTAARPYRAPAVDRLESSGFCSHLDCFPPQEWVRADGARVYSYVMGQFPALTSLELVERGGRIVLATFVFFERDRAYPEDLAAARLLVEQLAPVPGGASEYLTAQLSRPVDDVSHAPPLQIADMTVRAGTTGSTRSVRIETRDGAGR
jgi:hypothetical protein